MPTRQRKKATGEPAGTVLQNNSAGETVSREGRTRKKLIPKAKVATFLLLSGAAAACYLNASVGTITLIDPSSLQTPSNSIRNENEDTSCSNGLIVLHGGMFASMGIGCQLNSYVLASIAATYTDRKLVLLSYDPRFDKLGGSQFGCPSGNPDADLVNYPLGLSRLIKTPKWLRGNCSISCTGNPSFKVSCTNKDDGNDIPVLAMDGSDLRAFGMDEFFFKKSERAKYKNWTLDSEWYSRLGATPNDLEWLAQQRPITWNDKTLWDQIVSLLNRRGMVTLQPWVERDARYKVMEVGLPKKYIAVHIRRGDKLRAESKRYVVDYWKKLGYNETTQPTNYIPFSYYMQQVKPEDSQHITTVYVATDDPATVKEEIANLTNTTHGFTFVMNPDDASSTGHLQQGRDCIDRYNKTVAAVADLMILSRADIFVGEFNSNWGRLVRTFRTSFVNGTMGTGAPRDVRSVFGNWQPPGY